MTDAEFLEALAAKCEQETQVWLGFVNTERAKKLRRIAAQLDGVHDYTERYIDSDDLPYAVGVMNSIILEYESQRDEHTALRSELERVRQERDAWQNFAEHVMHCVECGEMSYETCPDGSRLYPPSVVSSPTEQT